LLGSEALIEVKIPRAAPPESPGRVNIYAAAQSVFCTGLDNIRCDAYI